ncbi:MAG: FG-GAP repeat protein [Geodermatophilaceae bacterium]|nr:FG-GAP repeat protein [Geodermatophilaceae bacterium]
MASPTGQPAGSSESQASRVDASAELAAVLQGSKLRASDETDRSDFGVSVAVDGDTALVGAVGHDTPRGLGAGAAYVFVRSGGRWIETTELTAPDGSALDGFGIAVALSGDTAVIGAFRDNIRGGAADTGSAYVFVRSGTTWTLQAKLTASDAVAREQFGQSVALDGDTVVVGAPADEEQGRFDAGSAYVFERSGTAWTEQARLVASDAAARDAFGWSVAVDADTVVVGAIGDDAPPARPDAGSAYVFVRSASGWVELAKLTASDAAEFASFGYSVAVSADTALIGAPGGSSPAVEDTGSAYVFVRSGSTWTEQAELTAADGATGDAFGLSVALRGVVAVVGSARDDTAAGDDVGSVYLFDRRGPSWTMGAKVVAPDGSEFDQLGVSVALDGSTVIAGAPGDGGTRDTGSAYIASRVALTAGSPGGTSLFP